MTILELLDRPIAFHRPFVTITGSIGAALMLSQMVYWSMRTRGDGWFYKTQEEWQEETGLNRREQENARSALKAVGVLAEKKQGIPCRVFYRVDSERLRQLLLGDSMICSPGVERIIQIFKATLNSLSRAGLARAERLGVAERELVDYEAVLKRDNGICHICKTPVERGPGQKKGFLQFDHVISLDAGGSHTFNNVKVSHANCNLSKGRNPQQTSLAIPGILDWPPQAGQSDQAQPSKAETPQETTAEKPQGPSGAGGVSSIKSKEEGFEIFWSSYPRSRRIAKAAALKAWVRKGCAAMVEDIVLSLEDQKTWPQWTRSEGRFIPHAVTWLNNQRWEDEPPVVKPTQLPSNGIF